MNFNDIKAALESDNQAPSVPQTLATLKVSEMPIQNIRKKMKIQLIIGPLFFILLFSAPSIITMPDLHRGVYYIFTLLAALSTIGFWMNTIWFIRKTANIQCNTKDTIVSFINDYKRTLEAFNTAFINFYLFCGILGYILGESLGLSNHNGRIEDSGLYKTLYLQITPLHAILYIIGITLVVTGANFLGTKLVEIQSRKDLKHLNEVLMQLEH